MEFEKAFGINIPDDQAEKISTVGDAIAYIEVPAGGSMSEIITGIPNVPNGATDIYFIANGDVSFDSWSMS